MNETYWDTFIDRGSSPTAAFEAIKFSLSKLRWFFYLVTPYETMYPNLESVPRYVVEMFPFFILMAVLENTVRLITRKGILRLNDSIASLSQGIFQECLRMKVRSIEIIVYCFVYDNFRLTTLPWNSVWTWYFCFICIDLGFYWAHRMAHEVHFIWAIHQAHHGGEDFTLVNGLRQAFLQPFTAWITYVPLALCIPPQVFLAHLQLGELFMFYTHTEVIKSLGPLEYILNTPSHHRVHHARNPNYIDKNYGGVLIIWDYIFGTFKAEDDNEPVAYGLVHPVNSYNPFYLQFHSWYYMFKKMNSMQGWKNKFLVPFMGPGWEPGKPRLGLISDIPEIKHPVVYWDPKISLLHKVYVIVHFGLVLLFYNELNSRIAVLNQFTITIGIVALLASMTSIGIILEDRWFAGIVESLRCLAFLVTEQYLLPIPELGLPVSAYRKTILFFIRSTFMTSFVVWSLVTLFAAAKRYLPTKQNFFKTFTLSKKYLKVQ